MGTIVSTLGYAPGRGWEAGMIRATEHMAYGFIDSRAFGLGVVDRVQLAMHAVPRSHVAFAEVDRKVTCLIRQKYPDAWEPALASFLDRPEMRQ